MLPLSLNSPGEIQSDIGQRARKCRLDLGLTQAELAQRAGVALRTLKLFEQTGKVSLEHLVKIAFALNAEAEFEALFPPRPPQRIEDVIASNAKPRQRARRS